MSDLMRDLLVHHKFVLSSCSLPILTELFALYKGPKAKRQLAEASDSGQSGLGSDAPRRGLEDESEDDVPAVQRDDAAVDPDVQADAEAEDDVEGDDDVAEAAGAEAGGSDNESGDDDEDPERRRIRVMSESVAASTRMCSRKFTLIRWWESNPLPR